MILAIDTALGFSVVSVIDKSEVIFAETGAHLRSHAEELGPMLDRAIGGRKESVEKVVVGRGPGSFTGLRVGLVAGQTIGWALSVPVVGVCSLDAIAVSASVGFTGFVVTDARRMELYWANYVEGTRQEGPGVDVRHDVRDRIRGARVVGDVQLLDEPSRRAKGDSQVSAESLALVASRVDQSGSENPARPYYLRTPDITPPSPAKSPLARPVSADGR